MKIPDFISPIIVWRVWHWDSTGLKSLNGEPWLPNKPLQAGCRVFHNGIRGGRASATSTPHHAPEFKCTCGIYGSNNLDKLHMSDFWRYGSVFGEVKLWGSVIEHEAGYRAEFAYPKTLHLPFEALPFTLKQIEIRIQSLIGYGCDLSIDHDGSTIPLWRKRLGLRATGLDFLMSRSQEWYARRKADRTLRPGDRIAVLGGGIAVVEHVSKEQVDAVLWNREVLRVRRNGITWDEQNMRWEIQNLSIQLISPKMVCHLPTRFEKASSYFGRTLLDGLSKLGCASEK